MATTNSISAPPTPSPDTDTDQAALQAKIDPLEAENARLTTEVKDLRRGVAISGIHARHNQENLALAYLNVEVQSAESWRLIHEVAEAREETRRMGEYAAACELRVEQMTQKWRLVTANHQRWSEIWDDIFFDLETRVGRARQRVPERESTSACDERCRVVERERERLRRELVGKTEECEHLREVRRRDLEEFEEARELAALWVEGQRRRCLWGGDGCADAGMQ